MFVHEYSDKRFATYEECAEDLLPEIDEDDIADELDLHKAEIIGTFLRRKNDEEFIAWLQEKVDGGIAALQEAFITEYEDEEVD